MIKENFDAELASELRRGELPVETRKFPALKKLAAETGRPFIFYDFETTGLPPRDWIGPFGITEIGFLRVMPDGTAAVFSRLLDPECPIHPEASRKTGITSNMLVGSPNWLKFGGPLFDFFRRRGVLCFGYNNLGFDRKCASHMNAVDGFRGKLPDAEKEFDLMLAAKRIFGRRISLEKAVAESGAERCFGFHRAAADAYASAALAEKFSEDPFSEIQAWTLRFKISEKEAGL